MGSLDGRVAVVTGAGRGIGREHALLFAAEGARVVVNDLGVAADGSGRGDPAVAQAVVDEIIARGGEAIANADDVADWQGARRLVETAVDTFGDLHVLVNNAGQGRAAPLLDTTEEQFDAFLAVHLKGTFATTRWAATYWRSRPGTDRSVVNTSSGAGVHGTRGSSGYAEAKAGVAASTAVAALELGEYGVRVNCIVPTARTRGSDGVRVREDAIPEATFDALHPGNVAPLAAYLATADCSFTGQLFAVSGGTVGMYRGWSIERQVDAERRWTVTELAAAMVDLPRELPVVKDAGAAMTVSCSSVAAATPGTRLGFGGTP